MCMWGGGGGGGGLEGRCKAQTCTLHLVRYLAAQPTECPGGGVALLAVLEHKKIVRVVVCGVQRDRLDQPMSAGVEVEVGRVWRGGCGGEGVVGEGVEGRVWREGVEGGVE